MKKLFHAALLLCIGSFFLFATVTRHGGSAEICKKEWQFNSAYNAEAHLTGSNFILKNLFFIWQAIVGGPLVLEGFLFSF